jgi:CrcB protein
MEKLFYIGIGGFFGAIFRYQLSGLIHNYFGAHFPSGTLVVNIVGCFLLGVLLTLAEGKFIISPQLRLSLAVGLLGAFTTFSTFSFETIALLQDKLYIKASINILLSVFLGLIAVWLGIIIARFI